MWTWISNSSARFLSWRWIGKVYRAVKTEKIAREHGSIRVIDESGEDYLYSAERFVEVKVPRAGREAVIKASNGS